ncbi:MAG TPA: GMC family oxidoreductase [Vicinamibacterales bacterium]|nr:GMC family oxidoreductase [Vicinamibacterales bacterium]
MTTTTHYHVIIIGSGAGGGTLAYRLAPSGARVLLLERGDYVRREQDNWSSHAVNVQGKYSTKESWTDGAGKPLHPHTNYYVGGNTKFYGSALFRLRREDFGELRHYGGVSPAWPIAYDDLEPYYAEAERLYHVHGTRGEDPTEPPASGPYPHPAVSHEPRIQQLSEDFARAGLRPFHVPLGIMLDEQNSQRSACIRCGTCDGFPCLLHAKSDAQVVCVDPAVAYPNVTLLTNAYVERLRTSASGREVTGVLVKRNGATESYSADIVIVSCGAINSAALLLRSANERHPNGLANSSGAVGRHYMGHVNSVLMAVSRCPNPTVFQKTLGVNDFYFGSREWDYPMGHISFVGKLDGVALSAGAPAIAPGFTLDLMAKHSLDFWLTSEDLPDPENRVTLDRQGQIVLTYKPNNDEGHKRLISRLESVMQQQSTCAIHGHRCHVGLFGRNLFVGQRIPLAGVAHQNGTLRFGADPRTSVLDANCRAHDLENLYAVDGSFFPSSGAVNPALTIMANALRVGDHLLERLGLQRDATAALLRSSRASMQDPVSAGAVS